MNLSSGDSIGPWGHGDRSSSHLSPVIETRLNGRAPMPSQASRIPCPASSYMLTYTVCAPSVPDGYTVTVLPSITLRSTSVIPP